MPSAERRAALAAHPGSTNPGRLTPAVKGSAGSASCVHFRPGICSVPAHHAGKRQALGSPTAHRQVHSFMPVNLPAIPHGLARACKPCWRTSAGRARATSAELSTLGAQAANRWALGVALNYMRRDEGSPPSAFEALQIYRSLAYQQDACRTKFHGYSRWEPGSCVRHDG